MYCAELMSGRGKPWGFSVPESSSGLKSLRKCKMKEKADDVVLIDVDNDSFPNVILLDIPETLQQNLRSSGLQRKGKNLPSQSIISIDEDESTEGDNKNGGGGDFDSDATSNKQSYSVPNHTNSSGDSDGEECQFVWERYPVKMPKCKRTYSKKAASGKRYGFVLDPGSSSSESDCSDCEILECSSGKFREQWEEASLKRKRFHDPNCAQFGMEDQTSASDSHTSTDDMVYDENAEELHTEAPGFSGSSDYAWENGNPSTFFAATDLGGCSLDPENGPHSANFRENIQNNKPSPSETEAGTEAFNKKKDPMNQNEEINGNFDHGSTSSAKRGGLGGHGVHWDFEDTSFEDMEKKILGETSVDGHQSGDEVPDIPQGPFSCNQSPSACDRTSFEKGGSLHSELCFKRSQSSHATEFRRGVDPSLDKLGHVQVKDFFGHIRSLRTDNSVGQENGAPIDEKPSFCHKQQDEVQTYPKNSGMEGKTPCDEPTSSSWVQNENGECGPDDNVTGTFQDNIVGIREKIKETDEYKRAIEEEWASRQRQLQIQAEEAQRLRKRRKAEAMRLLDMEKRQKQRLEEIRETQKKVEEHLSLKEELRVEVRRELHKLELLCQDMASLLRGLGIPVGGGCSPLSHQVHAAYKQALLRFHPDRASRTDIRQQVEAEEKFKLISRMKEKLLIAS